MSRQVQTDNWHWVALGSGVGATLLLLLLLYGPNGIWKAALIVLLAVTLAVMLANPRNRLLAIGTTSCLTALVGFAADISFNLSATFPGGGILQGGVEGGSDVPPFVFLLLLFLGLVAVAVDAVGRGWLFPSLRRKDETRPDLTFALSSADVVLTSEFSRDGWKRFHIRLSVSKDAGIAVRLTSVAIKDASIAEFAVGIGDGVQTSQTVDGTSASEMSILGDFPDAKLSRGRAKRKITVVDEFNRQWVAGQITFQSEA